MPKSIELSPHDLDCDDIYRVFFSKGPTQKISKYGIGPTQQDKMAKYTGPTQSNNSYLELFWVGPFEKKHPVRR